MSVQAVIELETGFTDDNYCHSQASLSFLRSHWIHIRNCSTDKSLFISKYLWHTHTQVHMKVFALHLQFAVKVSLLSTAIHTFDHVFCRRTTAYAYRTLEMLFVTFKWRAIYCDTPSTNWNELLISVLIFNWDAVTTWHCGLSRRQYSKCSRIFSHILLSSSDAPNFFNCHVHVHGMSRRPTWNRKRFLLLSKASVHLPMSSVCLFNQSIESHGMNTWHSIYRIDDGLSMRLINLDNGNRIRVDSGGPKILIRICHDVPLGFESAINQAVKREVRATVKMRWHYSFTIEKCAWCAQAIVYWHCT